MFERWKKGNLHNINRNIFTFHDGFRLTCLENRWHKMWAGVLCWKIKYGIINNYYSVESTYLRIELYAEILGRYIQQTCFKKNQHNASRKHNMIINKGLRFYVVIYEGAYPLPTFSQYRYIEKKTYLNTVFVVFWIVDIFTS